ncbi:UPF0157 protein [Jannaschia pagri]|uniref:UPF0157 protein n=1 Tax=Jannaschia pagri TaxID=2829797 RepID=A0ABQ4NGM7_9RHOB|nr:MULTISPECIES: GrpB family protein [unclassified Jannaschia]GIT90321.1 UPF0157 protein [Jannaschia sp. AI_61]GIT93573.1 UPF0157 protein [Jannaschia sp. AI_62]
MSGDDLGLRPGTLALRPYSVQWAIAFDTCRTELAAHLPSGTVLHHIGSTAVPGLAAKPILDLATALPLAQHDDLADVLTGTGWEDRGPRSGRLFVRMRDGLRTHNLHVYDLGAPDLADQLAFRDRLRRNAGLRAAYAAEKERIIQRGTARADYADAKTDFILRALRDPTYSS